MASILSMQWPVSSSRRQRILPPSLLVVAGALHQFRGQIAVVRGTLLHNDILRARGYRQQLVGMLQRFWKRDRKSIETWVDALLRRNASHPPARHAWRARTATPVLYQET
jgi:hypothetical protein